MISPNEFPGDGPEQNPCPKAESAKAKSGNLDSANHFDLVPVGSDLVLVHKILVRGPIRLTRNEALNLAAWLVVTAGQVRPDLDAYGEFQRLVNEIKKT